MDHGGLGLLEGHLPLLKTNTCAEWDTHMLCAFWEEEPWSTHGYHGDEYVIAIIGPYTRQGCTSQERLHQFNIPSTSRKIIGEARRVGSAPTPRRSAHQLKRLFNSSELPRSSIRAVTMQNISVSLALGKTRLTIHSTHVARGHMYPMYSRLGFPPSVSLSIASKSWSRAAKPQ
jgi:hypothetical protein